MEQGLAQTMVYGDGEGNTVKHYYAGTVKPSQKSKKHKKKVKKSCKK